MKNIRIERPFLAFGATLLASLVALADDGTAEPGNSAMAGLAELPKTAEAKRLVSGAATRVRS